MSKTIITELDSHEDKRSLSPSERLALIPVIAQKRFEGLGEQKIADEVKLSRRQVRNILNTKEYKEFLDDLASKATANAVAAFKSELDKMTPLALKALRHNLEEGKLDSVKLWSQLVGALTPETKTEQQGSVTVVVPSGILPEGVIKID